MALELRLLRTDSFTAKTRALRALHEQRLAESTRDARLALLSPKEKAILDEVIKGLSSKEIAQQQGLSARTVENHRARIMEKLRAKSVVDLVREFK